MEKLSYRNNYQIYIIIYNALITLKNVYIAFCVIMVRFQQSTQSLCDMYIYTYLLITSVAFPSRFTTVITMSLSPVTTWCTACATLFQTVFTVVSYHAFCNYQFLNYKQYAHILGFFCIIIDLILQAFLIYFKVHGLNFYCIESGK